MKKHIHVVPRGSGWATKQEGAQRAGNVTDSLKQSIETTREQAKREIVEVVIHCKDGTIRDSDG